MNVEQLNEYQLTDLQAKITQRLKDIELYKKDQTERKNSVKNKTKFCQLTRNDRVFGISISQGKLYDFDYCDVENFGDDSKYPEWYTFGISHKTKPMGIYNASIRKERAEQKGYYLSEMCGSSYFFTLSPKTWEADLAEALQYMVKCNNEYHKKEISTLKKKIGSILKHNESKNKVNEFLLNN